jgi:trehalose 6-phosphate phosphatase
VPSTARPLDGVSEVLTHLAARFAKVAVVSGRPAGFQLDRLGLLVTGSGRAVELVGLYGMESVAPDGTVVLDAVAASWLPVVLEAADRLASGAPDGVLVEAAGPSVTVHWRRAPGAARWAAERAAAASAATGLVAHGGRLSVELRPPLDLDKGVVVRRLTVGCRAVGFFGDDLGDLPAFAELGRLRADGVATVGVAVIDRETAPEVETAADLSVPGPEGARAVLEWLATQATGPVD